MKSGSLPRILDILLAVDGCSLMICFAQLCLFPGREKLTYPLYPIMFVAEFGLSLWLLIKGVKDLQFAQLSLFRSHKSHLRLRSRSYNPERWQTSFSQPWHPNSLKTYDLRLMGWALLVPEWRTRNDNHD